MSRKYSTGNHKVQSQRLALLPFYLFTFLLLTSCSDWLDVQPSTQKDREELTEKAEGYKQILYGSYINLAKTQLYGSNLSYGFLEVLATNYANTSNFYSSSGNYNYTDTGERGYVDAIWSNMYNNIANINSMLYDIDGHKDLFNDGEYELCAGEGYAMRAFMHFDLLRMFAPRYEGHENTISVPYYDNYEIARFPHLPERLVIQRVLRDLDRADSLFQAGSDPIISTLTDITYNGNGNFKANRQYRFNYWTVQALRARVYLYIGDTENALRYANMVINQGPFKWTTETEVSAGDKVFQSELITALDVPDLPDYYESNFANSRFTLTDGWGIYGQDFFGDANDYRFLYLMTNDKDNNKVVPSKYDQEIGSNEEMKKQTIPLVRMSEMYLIAAECYADAGNLQQAIGLLRTLKLHRGYLSEGQGIDDNATADQIQTYIRDEMRKDTYGEGQSWFYMKRRNLNTIVSYSPWGVKVSYGTSWSNPITEDTYVFPLPESEKEYGNIPNDTTTTK